MLDSVITYNGNSSEDVGLKVERYPAIIKADRKHEKVSVPGRNGDIYFFQDAWNNYIQPYEVFAGDRAPAAAQAAWENIISWLCQQDDELTVDDFKNLTLHGYHQLIDSYEPDVIRLAAFASGVAAENSWNRFGRATIDFDCRPERFTADAFDWIDLSEESETYSGSLVSFEGSGAPMADLKVDIEPIQSGSGDPSPTNVRPISGWDSVDVNVVEKNLLPYPYNSATSTNNGITFTANSDGSVTVNGTATGTAVFILKNMNSWKTLPSGTYTLSGCPSGGGNGRYALIAQFYDNGTFKGLYDYGSGATDTYLSEVAMPISSSNFYIAIWQGTTFNNETFKPMLERGSSVTAFEAYNGNTTTVDLGQTVYGGSLDVTSGVLTVDKIHYKGSDLTWAIASTTNYQFRCNEALPIIHGSNNAYLTTGICSAYKAVTVNATYNQNSFGVNYGAQLYVRDDRFSDLASFVSSIADVDFVFPLATPTTVTLTPTQVNTLLGQNNVWADSGDVEVKLFPTLNNPTDRNAKPFLKVTGSGNGTVVLNGYVINITGMTDYLYIDCESQNCFRLLAENKNNLITLTNGFPELKPGENAVGWTGGVTNVEIVPRWWRL